MSSFALQSLLALSAAARAPSSASRTRSTIRARLRILPGQPQIFQLSRRDMFLRAKRDRSRRVLEARRQQVRRARRRPACRRRLQDPKAARRQKIRALPTRARRLRARQCSLVGAARALCRDRNRVVDASRAPGRDDLVGFNALVPLDKIRSSPISFFEAARPVRRRGLFAFVGQTLCPPTEMAISG
jgi:hypothetical protein